MKHVLIGGPQLNICQAVLTIVGNAANGRIVDGSITVFVDAVPASLGHPWVDGDVRIIAIRAIRNVARRSRRARLNGHRGIAIPIRVDIGEECAARAALTLVRRIAHLTVRLFLRAGRSDAIIARCTTRIVPARREARRRAADVG